ncbi:MAG TPA: HAD-IA family hydrolase [Caulifigura sp.]|jgi:putative hydrolase of the HAD superfamily|nr:HAD-IA family hydrolase [Caulifigura sp.]
MAAPPPISCVLFDAVGTLIFGDPPPHMAYHRIGRRHGSSITPPEASRRFKAAMAAAPRDLETSPAREREFWQSVVAEVLPDAGDKDVCFQELWNHFANPSCWAVYADVEETFQALRDRNIQIAIASNFDERLHSVCDGHAELKDVTARFVSSELGWKKPARQFFQSIAARLELAPASIVMIGDDPVTDIEAARSAGLQAIHINRTAESGESALTSLTDLLARLPPPA